MDANGSHVRQLTFKDRDDEVPAWSPDGKQIVFARDFDPIRGETDNDLYRDEGRRQPSSATSRTRRASRTSSPTGRPTAERIAFDERTRRRRRDLHDGAATARGIRQLTDNDR